MGCIYDGWLKKMHFIIMQLQEDSMICYCDRHIPNLWNIVVFNRKNHENSTFCWLLPRDKSIGWWGLNSVSIFEVKLNRVASPDSWNAHHFVKLTWFMAVIHRSHATFKTDAAGHPIRPYQRFISVAGMRLAFIPQLQRSGTWPKWRKMWGF